MSDEEKVNEPSLVFTDKRVQQRKNTLSSFALFLFTYRVWGFFTSTAAFSPAHPQRVSSPPSGSDCFACARRALSGALLLSLLFVAYDLVFDFCSRFVLLVLVCEAFAEVPDKMKVVIINVQLQQKYRTPLQSLRISFPATSARVQICWDALSDFFCSSTMWTILILKKNTLNTLSLCWN